MADKNLSLFIIGAIFIIINSSFACSSQFFNNQWRPQPKPNAPLLEIACGDGLCTSSKYYPAEGINFAVDMMFSIFSNWQRYGYALKNKVNPRVLDLFTKRSQVNNNAKIKNPTECFEYSYFARPLEGYGMDGKPYFIVNVRGFTQEIKISECRFKNFCALHYSKFTAKCVQSYRVQDLLAVPARRGQFTFLDLTIQSFVVRNGCDCDFL